MIFIGAGLVAIEHLEPRPI